MQRVWIRRSLVSARLVEVTPGVPVAPKMPDDSPYTLNNVRGLVAFRWIPFLSWKKTLAFS